MITYDIILDVSLVFHWYSEFTIFIHYVDIGNLVKSMFCYGLAMFCGSRTPSFVSCIAFYDGAVHMMDQFSDEFRLKIIMTARLTSADFHSDSAMSLLSKCLINLN